MTTSVTIKTYAHTAKLTVTDKIADRDETVTAEILEPGTVREIAVTDTRSISVEEIKV